MHSNMVEVSLILKFEHKLFYSFVYVFNFYFLGLLLLEVPGNVHVSDDNESDDDDDELDDIVVVEGMQSICYYIIHM